MCNVRKYKPATNGSHAWLTRDLASAFETRTAISLSLCLHIFNVTSLLTMSSLHVSKISLTSFHKVLACYPTTAPEKLRDLDAHRYDVIPSAVASRNGSNKHLTKPEVEKLVEWKLFVSLSRLPIRHC